MARAPRTSWSRSAAGWPRTASSPGRSPPGRAGSPSCRPRPRRARAPGSAHRRRPPRRRPRAPSTGLNAFLAAAQRQGAELVEVARQQAERIAGEARSEGYETGYAEGRATAEREVADLLAFAEGAVREVAETRQQLLDDAEPALVRLAIQVAEKVLQAKLELEPERVADVLRGALRKALRAQPA